MQIAGLEVTSPEQNLLNWGLCIALYGQSGMGKTTLAGTIAKSKHAGDVYYVDCQGGSHVLAGQNLPIKVLAPSNFTQLDALNKELLKINGGTFIFDLLTEMQKMHLAHMSTASNREWKHYTRSQEWLELFVRQWRDKSRMQGVNVIFVLQESIDQREDNKRWITRLNLTPHIAGDLPYLLDYVGYIGLVKDGSEERLISFAPSSKFATKTRRPLVGPGSDIPKIIYHPDLAILLDTLKGDQVWPKHFNTPRTVIKEESTENG